MIINHSRSGQDSERISQLLEGWRDGDQQAFEELLPLVYNQLRRIALAQLRHERPGHTLQPTALVHEAYLRLAGQRNVNFQNRAHFFAVCAKVMRRILVDHARKRKSFKREVPAEWIEAAEGVPREQGVEILALDEALNELEKIDPQQSRIIELRYFAGLSIPETAEVVGVSPATVKRDWSTGRAWLKRQVERGVRE